MSHRHPSLQGQTELLRKAFEAKGLALNQGESLELISRLNGFPSWNVAKRKVARPEQGSAPGNALPPLRFQVWTALHHHRHGEDIYYFQHHPSEAEVIELINNTSSFEEGESVEVLGVESFDIDVPEQYAVQASKSMASPLVGLYEIQMTDLLDYETPEQTPEWQWVQSLAAFSHKGNGLEPGVWEFMVHADKLQLHQDTTPDKLKPEVERALQHGAAWVVFHQG